VPESSLEDLDLRERRQPWWRWPRTRSNDPIDVTLRQLRRVFVIIAGTLVLLVGVAMIVLPGPAFVVIPAGLGILALEFFWARRLLVRLRRMLRAAAAKARSTGSGSAPPAGGSAQPPIQGGDSSAISP
jgi:uncharacterized protein (TIGR02611 family)